MNLTTTDAKIAARALRRSLSAAGLTVSHGKALELVAQQLGFADWNTAAATLEAERESSGPAVPVLRIQEEKLARDFYVDYLSFGIEWEHRFEDGMPLYLRVRRGDTVLDLSEHHGDGTPGSVVWVPVQGIRAFHAELSARPHPRLRPGIDHDAPGGPTMEVTDPWGNVLRFCENLD